MWEGDAIVQDSHSRPRDGIGNGDSSGRKAANKTWRRLAGRPRKGGGYLSQQKEQQEPSLL